MNHATAPLAEIERALAEPLYTYDDFLASMAKECRNCPSCGNPPCDGCCAGGICDQSSCRCFDDRDDIFDDPQSSDDLDAEGESP